MEIDSPKSIDWLFVPLPIGCDYENAALCEWFSFEHFFSITNRKLKSRDNHAKHVQNEYRIYTEFKYMRFVGLVIRDEHR